jgi:hypothetical protein
MTKIAGSGSGSISQRHGSADTDPHQNVMDPEHKFKFSLTTDCLGIVNIFLYVFFLITCPQAHHLQSEQFKFLLKFCVKIVFFTHYFSPLNTFM